MRYILAGKQDRAIPAKLVERTMKKNEMLLKIQSACITPTALRNAERNIEKLLIGIHIARSLIMLRRIDEKDGVWLVVPNGLSAPKIQD